MGDQSFFQKTWGFKELVIAHLTHSYLINENPPYNKKSEATVHNFLSHDTTTCKGGMHNFFPVGKIIPPPSWHLLAGCVLL